MAQRYKHEIEALIESQRRSGALGDEFRDSPIMAYLMRLLQDPGSAPGLSSAALAALRGRAIDEIPGRFETQASNLKTSLARRGLLTSAGPASGLAIPQLSGLATAMETTRSNALRDVTLADEEARRGNLQTLLQGGLGIFGNLSQALLGANQQFGQGAMNRANIGAQGNYSPWMEWGMPIIGAAAGAAGSYLGRPPSSTTAGFARA